MCKMVAGSGMVLAEKSRLLCLESIEKPKKNPVVVDTTGFLAMAEKEGSSLPFSVR